MRAVIVSGGTINNLSLITDYLNDDSVLIACDKGLNYIYRLKLRPDVILGDFDSVDKTVLEHYEQIGIKPHIFPVRKDNTDTELGIFAARDMEADDIILLGATGTRIDHTLANIQIMLPLVEEGIRARLIDEHNIAELICGSLTIVNKRNCYISLLPFTPVVEGVTTYGFDYPMTNMKIEVGTSLTVSNRLVSDKARVDVKKGILLCIIAND